VCQRSEVLGLYILPYDPAYPLVCFDESCKQLISETRPPLPPEPGQPERFDYQYEREGVSNIFMFFGSSLPFMLNQQTRCQDNILLTQKFRKFLKP
jgi:hypothetical protein